MDALFKAVDIVLSETKRCFPPAKIASFSLGAVSKGKQLKKVFEAFKEMKSLGQDFLIRIYNVFRHKLNWSISKIRQQFHWINRNKGSKLDGLGASEFMRKLKEEFGVSKAVFKNDDHNKNNDVFKIATIPQANLCIYMELYRDSRSGYAWTIEFATGNCNASKPSQLAPSFKIRFDEL